MLTDSRKTTIRIREVNSAYAFANRKRLAELQINRTIGSSITTVNKMLGNSEEQRFLMQDIISIAPNSPDWNKQLKDYWNSFSIDIPEQGRELEIGFVYDIQALDKQSYIKAINSNIEATKDKVKTDEDLKNYIDKRIEAVKYNFNNALKSANSIKNNKQRQSAIDTAFKIKYDNIVKLEAERFKVGNPINNFDYILWRYCLIYGDVANEPSLISKSNKIRFYLHSDEDIKQEKKTKQKDNRLRTKLLLEVTENVENMTTFLYAMGEGNNIPNDDVELYDKIEKLSISNTGKFINVASNKDLKLLGAIEKYIASGLFIRHIGSTAVYNSTDLDKPIGNNVDEVLTYLKNPTNKALVEELKTKYKNLVN